MHKSHPNEPWELGIDSMYCIKTLLKGNTDIETHAGWREIWAIIRNHVSGTSVKHIPSHKEGYNPDHKQLDKELQEFEVLVEKNKEKGEVDPFIKWLHECTGHFGIQKEREWIRQYTGGESIIGVKEHEKIHKACKICHNTKRMNQLKYAYGAYNPEYYKPGNHWQIDLIGPLPNAKQYPKGVIVVDLGSRSTMVIPLKKTKAEHILKALEKIMAAWGRPQIIQSDGGPPFGSKKLEQWSMEKGITWHLNLPYHPQSSGVVEKKIDILKQHLKMATKDGTFKGWHLVLDTVLLNVNEHTSRWPDIKPKQQPNWEPSYKQGEKIWIVWPTEDKEKRVALEGTVMEAGKLPFTYVITTKTRKGLAHHNWLSSRE